MPPRTAKLEDAVLNVATKLVGRRVETAKAAVRKAAVKEAANIFRWLADQIRSELGAAPPELRQQMGVGWHSLSNKTLGKSHWRGAPLSYRAFKREEFDNQAFFLLDGDLATRLDSVVPTKAFGAMDARSKSVSMRFNAQGQGNFEVRLKVFPKIPPGARNADLSWMVAQQTANPKVTWGKLMNPMGRPRQLLLPTLLYFAHVRIPRAARGALRAHGFKVK